MKRPWIRSPVYQSATGEVCSFTVTADLSGFQMIHKVNIALTEQYIKFTR